MKKILLTVGTLGAMLGSAFAGGVSGTIRSQYTWDVENSKTEMKVTRAYVTYKNTFENGVMGRITFDVNNAPKGDEKMDAYLKYAYFTMPVIDKLSFTIGLQVALSYAEPDQLFGYGYAGYNSIVYGQTSDGTSSSDAGVSAAYKATDDITVKIASFTGNGYKHQSAAQDLLYALDVVYKKGGILAKFYGSVKPYNGNDEVEESQYLFSPFVGMDLGDFRFGATYSQEINKDGSKADDAQIKSAGIFAASKVIDGVEAFARYRMMMTDVEDSDIVHHQFCGLQYKPEEQIKIAVKYTYEFAGSETNKSELGIFTEVSF